MRLLGLSGSLRRDSLNTRLLRAAANVLPPGVELQAWEQLKTVPPFDEDDEAAPALAVERLRAAVRQADAVLVATPEYNGTLPGQLKNALDWLSRPLATNVLRGKPVAVVGASTGMFGAVWAQADARKTLGIMGARVVDGELPVAGAHRQLLPDGRLADPALEQRLRDLCHALVREVRRDERAA